MILGLGAVSWRSRKQSVPADSTTEAEYVATAEAMKEITQVHSTPLLIENTFTIKLAKNPKFHDRTKHINIKYH